LASGQVALAIYIKTVTAGFTYLVLISHSVGEHA
jgi:hypothetical protein